MHVCSVASTMPCQYVHRQWHSQKFVLENFLLEATHTIRITRSLFITSYSIIADAALLFIEL